MAVGSVGQPGAQVTAAMFVQCRTVKIAILGDEGVPVQVDGEAWVQPPGCIRIIHKNRAQTLTRDRVRAAGGSWALRWGLAALTLSSRSLFLRHKD